MYTYWCHSRDRADIQTHFSSKNQTISYCIKQKCLVVWTIAFRRHTGLLTSVPSHLRIQLHTKCMRYSSQTGRNSTPETKRSKFTYSAHAWRLMHVSLVMLVLHELRFMKPTARPSTFSRLCKPLHQAVKIKPLKNQCATRAVPTFKTKDTTFPLVMHACDSKHLSRCFCLCFRLRRHTCFLDLATWLSVVFICRFQLFGGFL